MDRLSTGIVIALATLAFSGGMMRDVMASGPAAATQPNATIKSPEPAMTGFRSGWVLSLVLTLDALRAAPALLDTSKV